MEGSTGAPKSPAFGMYDYFKIVKALSDEGFLVISEIRDRNTDVNEYAGKTARQISYLLRAGVPPGKITVVGGSKGGIIAIRVSNILKNRKMKYVILAGFFKSGTWWKLSLARRLSMH